MADLLPRDFLPLTTAQFHVLVALAAGDSHGYAIMRAVEASSGDVVKMGPATLYGTLKRLVASGLAEEIAPPGVPGDDSRRRYYRMTQFGERVCAAEADRLDALVRTAQVHLRPRLA